MKVIIKIYAFIFFLTSTSCYGQKLVQYKSEAKNLEINKEQFIGKPLKTLLKEIGPKIEFVFGNPDNTWAGATGGTFLAFHFVDKYEYGEKLRVGKKPVSIIVNFQLDPNNNRKPIPKEGINSWTKKDMIEYGDLIIVKIRVTGE